MSCIEKTRVPCDKFVAIALFALRRGLERTDLQWQRHKEIVWTQKNASSTVSAHRMSVGVRTLSMPLSQRLWKRRTTRTPRRSRLWSTGFRAPLGVSNTEVLRQAVMTLRQSRSSRRQSHLSLSASQHSSASRRTARSKGFVSVVSFVLRKLSRPQVLLHSDVQQPPPVRSPLPRLPSGHLLL